MQLLRYEGKKALSTLLLVVFVAFSFLAILPISTISPVNVAGSPNVADHSADEVMPICGTPMYNDPEYLRTMVTYVDTMQVFTGVGEPMDVAPSAEASGTLFSEISPSPSPATYSRHIMCKGVVSWNPVNPTTTFLPTDSYAYLLMTVTVNSEIKSYWYYRHDDTDAWVYYDELASPVPYPATWDYWVRLPIAGKTYPRAWRIRVYLDGTHHFNEYFEITDDGWQSVTCEGVVGGNPDNIKDTFTIGVDPQVYYYLRLYDVAYYNEITDHCHDYLVLWYQPDDTLFGTMGPDGWPDYKNTDPTYDAWGSAWVYGYMTLDSSTPTGQWRIETYIDKYYDSGEQWYLLTTTTFNVAGAGAEVFYYFEFDQTTGWATQKTVAADFYGQTADGNFEIYYDQADPHIGGTYLSYVAEAALNSWSQLVPYLGAAYDQDGDGRIEVLIVNLNKYDEIAYGGGILGYVQSNDANGLGMIYLDNNIDVWTLGGWNTLRHTFSHEFTHRIQYSNDPFEEGWIMEGMAQFGGDYAWPFSEFQGYVNTLQNNPDVQLTGDTYAAYYCAAYVFFEYLAEEFGTSAVRTVLERTITDQGITAVENAVGAPFDTLFDEFTVRNYANDYAGTATTFEGIDIHAVPIASHTVPPSAGGGDGTNLWATDYVKFVAPSSTLEISFGGDPGRAYQVEVIKVVGDFLSHSTDVIPLTNNQGSIVIPNAHTYSQIALMITRHDDPYPTSSWSYNVGSAPTVGIDQLETLLLNAPANTVYFIFADPAYMTRAEATYDVASGGIVYGLCTNTQHLGFDTTPGWLLPSGAINTATISDATVAMFGGPAPHVAVRYYEGAGLTPVKAAGTATHYMFLDQADAVVAALAITAVAGGHEDMFVVEVFEDGDNTIFVVYGFDWKGTWAGGIYFKEVISKNLGSYPEACYIFHWVDGPPGYDGIPQSPEIHPEASV